MPTYELSQAIQAANSPETISLRQTNDEVPDGVAAYRIVRAVVTDQSSTQNDVEFQDYDNDNAVVDTSVTVSVAADGTEMPGSELDGPLLTVPRGNQIRVSVEGDADTTLYIEPDSL